MAGPFRDYDAFAEASAEHTRTNAYSAHDERPAIRALLGPVAGFRVLDAGCAAGEHALWLVDSGATVTAIDISDAMLHLARTRLDGRALVLAADLAEPLPFARASFDVIFRSLTLHYVLDWERMFAELPRIVVPGGTLVVSTHHPSILGSTIILRFAKSTIAGADTARKPFGSASSTGLCTRSWHRCQGRVFASPQSRNRFRPPNLPNVIHTQTPA